ncbi:unnamed protein product [Aureobasidium mustum]|uniref:Vacuolar protein sorting-associated protein 17 n=1 Tax=Aureobasidium mustum TaxID=2773714 RepID=A0A9N8K3M5_9PEZI|nr:unnamed protein product [Aureobasidium mustum]
MDYSSAIANDAGRDPWASSPQHDRSTFPQANNHDVPPTNSTSRSPTTTRPAQSLNATTMLVRNTPPQQPSHHQQPPQNYQQQQQQQQQPQQLRKQYKLQAKITALERTGRKDPVLRFDVYTNLPKFRTTQFRDVRRTHSEFVKFADHLISSNPEAFVPAVPPPLTAAGVGTEEDEVRVKASMQRWLNTVCSNHVLMRDEEMVFFVESDFGYSPVVRRKQPATGVRRKYIKQFAPPPDDTPELLEARPIVKSFYLGTMDLGQKVDKVVKSRRALGLAESDFGVKMGHMQVQETHSGLANAYKKLGKVIQAVGDFHAAQGTAEATTLADPLQYHSSDAFIVKETLTNLKRDKVDEALAALDEARSHEAHLKEKTDRVTENLVHERREWTARTTSDLRAAIREYVMREIEAERRTLATLEQVRPDVRNIDASGGLSRLGREAHPVIRRTSLASSQGPKGDAWSGVPRRPDGLNRSISGSFAGTGTVPEDAEAEQAEEGTTGRKRATSSASSLGRLEEDDEDRIDARNAASRLAQTTF